MSFSTLAIIGFSLFLVQRWRNSSVHESDPAPPVLMQRPSTPPAVSHAQATDALNVVLSRMQAIGTPTVEWKRLRQDITLLLLDSEAGK